MRLIFILRNWIWTLLHRHESDETPQIIITVHNFDTSELRDRFNTEGYQYFPILYDEDYVLHVLELEDRLQKKEEK